MVDLTPEKLVEEGMVSVRDAAKLTTLSRSELYAMMDRGELTYAKIGRRRLIPRKALVSMLAAAVVGLRQPDAALVPA